MSYLLLSCLPLFVVGKAYDAVFAKFCFASLGRSWSFDPTGMKWERRHVGPVWAEF
jgi:hypothetical protein